MPPLVEPGHVVTAKQPGDREIGAFPDRALHGGLHKGGLLTAAHLIPGDVFLQGVLSGQRFAVDGLLAERPPHRLGNGGQDGRAGFRIERDLRPEPAEVLRKEGVIERADPSIWSRRA